MMGEKGESARDMRALSKNKIDWPIVVNIFNKISRAELLEAVSRVLLQVKSKPSPNLLLKYIDENSRESFIKTAIVQLMSTPEYQLC